LQESVRDPRLGIITLQEVRVTKNLAHAKIFFTCLGGDVLANAKLLNKTLAGFLRHELAKRTQMRVMPELHFIHDESVERGAYLTDLIHQAAFDIQANQADQANQTDQTNQGNTAP
jgi:ribosome-binding factor A